MRHLARTVLLPIALLTGHPAYAQGVSISPEQIGQIFCIGSLGNDMSPVFAVLSDDLRAVIDDASAKSQEFAIAHPGEKPPLGDGLPWRTLPDYADGCTVGDASVRDLVASVVINYTFSQEPSANYSNALVLLPDYPENGSPYIWRIYDINLGQGRGMGTGDGTTMRETIYGAFEE